MPHAARYAASFLALLLLAISTLAQDAPERVSEFGRYEGWSEARFDGWETFSTYVEMRDGVRLAVDVTLPSSDGVVTDEPLPLVWTHSRYHRRMFGRSMAELIPYLQELLRHGYVVASVAARGSGASYGRYEGLFSEAETRDAAEMIEWFAAQPFCDGNVGMYGGSYLGITQYMAASTDPPALKAIFPEVAAFDMYDTIHPGGVFRDDLMRHWDGLTRQLDRTVPPARVDEDGDGELLRAAVAEHGDNWEVLIGYSAGRHRDHSAPGLTYTDHGPTGCLAEIDAASVPTYHANGWYDVFAADTMLWFANFDGPQKVVMGDWSHAQLSEERTRLTAVEQHRWFDRWLKGIENGVEEGPPLHYALMVEPGETVWMSADAWPPADATARTLWFAGGPSESVASVNDGRLVSERPDAGSHAYEVDPSTTTGTSTRWDNAVGAAPRMQYAALAENDAKCLTYTTAPLAEDLTVVGHPVVTLWVTASAGDACLHVLLEEVDEQGAVRYVTEGVLRASQRKLAEAPWNNLGLPYQRCFAEDADPLSIDEPAEVRMDLHPTATVFDAGHRLRLVVMCADADNTEAPDERSSGTLTVFVGGVYASAIELPVL